MSIAGNSQIVHDNLMSVTNVLKQLITNINNSIQPLTDAGATDSLAKVQALKDAMAPVQQAVLDASAAYDEAEHG